MGIDVEIVARVKGQPDDAQIARWSWDLCSSIGARHFWLNTTDSPPRRALELSGSRYREDGDTSPGSQVQFDMDRPFYAGKDHYLLCVSTMGRYYAPGYERGDILTYCAIAEWIEANMPAEVWYGGDSSGIQLERFDSKRRAELRAHLYSSLGREYFNYEKPQHQPASCALCIPNEPRFSQHGFGGNYCAVNCAGCGKSWSTRDKGETWTEADER